MRCGPVRHIREDHARAAAEINWGADGGGGQVIFARPVRAPAVRPAEIGAVERHEEPVALILILIRAEPVEAVIKTDTVGIAQTPRDNLEIRSHIITTQHAAHAAPVIAWILISSLIVVLAEGSWGRKIRRIGRPGHAPEFTKGFRRNAVGFIGKTLRLGQPFAVSLRHVEFAIRCPSQAMQAVLDVAEIGEDLDVFIGRVVAIKVAHNGQIWSIRHPQIAPMPG